MYYLPIIKLKNREISKASYLKDYFNNPNVFPFLELQRYGIDETRKNKSISDFLTSTGIKSYFLGIPHKPSVIKHGAANDSNCFYLKANANNKMYLSESINLFGLSSCIPTFYIYDKSDFLNAFGFISKARKLNRTIALITTPQIAKQVIKEDILDENDFLMLDLEEKSIKAYKPIIEEIVSEKKCKIILIRENRKPSTFNTAISLDEQAPLLPDLSMNFNDPSLNTIVNNLFGFGDYCGSKNDISTGSKIDRSNFFPAVALYQKQEIPSYFLGIKSEEPLSKGGFENLFSLITQRQDTLELSKIKSVETMLKNEKHGDYAFWSVFSQWFYIAKMSIFDSWKSTP